MNKVFFTIFVLFTFSLKSYGLCEGKINTGQDLMFQEKDFTKEKYQSNLKLMKSFPREFMVMTDISQAQSFETWIGYRNSLLIVEGYVLKQTAELTSKEEDIDRFCNFINSNIIDH